MSSLLLSFIVRFIIVVNVIHSVNVNGIHVNDETTTAMSFESAFADTEEQQSDHLVHTHQYDADPNNRYCRPSLCELYDGVQIRQVPHIACHNDGNYSEVCGVKPYLLFMGETRRNLILNMHNLARERIASGRLEGYSTAVRMPLIRWDNELEYLATLHVKRCQFAHDQCHNMIRFPFSGQNIGYFWIQGEIRSFTKHMKRFIINWFKEYTDANQTFIDRFQPHPKGKKIGHFTVMVSDHVHRVGCAAIRYHQPEQLSITKFLMTCNYDYTNFMGEPIYESGATASGCGVHGVHDKFTSLCDWPVDEDE